MTNKIEKIEMTGEDFVRFPHTTLVEKIAEIIDHLNTTPTDSRVEELVEAYSKQVQDFPKGWTGYKQDLWSKGILRSFAKELLNK